MVDALREVHRVLAAGGRLVDIRPLSQDVRVDLVGPGKSANVGELDESEYRSADLDSDSRMQDGVRQGRFRQEGQIRVGFHWYFESLDAFVEYVTEYWEDRLEDATLTRAAEALAASPPGTRIRVHKPIQLTWYSKLTAS